MKTDSVLQWIGVVVIGGSLLGCGRASDPGPTSNAEQPDEEGVPTTTELAETIEKAEPGNGPGGLASESKVEAFVEALPERWEAGETYDLTLVLEIEENWHVNANPASMEFLIPTSLAIQPETTATLESVDYPQGHGFQVAQLDEKIDVYEGEVQIPFTVRLDSSLEPGQHDVNAVVSIQACDDQTCLAPGEIVITLPVTVTS